MGFPSFVVLQNDESVELLLEKINLLKKEIESLTASIETNNLTISFVKAEKVVKEPKKPMIINGLISSLLKKFIAKKIPIKKQPIKFTVNVPIGNPKKITFERNELTRNLKIAPKKAPIPIRK